MTKLALVSDYMHNVYVYWNFFLQRRHYQIKIVMIHPYVIEA